MPQLDQWGIPDITDYRYERQYGDDMNDVIFASLLEASLMSDNDHDEKEHVNEAGKKYCEENPVLVACDKTPTIITDARTGISIMIDFDFYD